ncbi:hypothetical protein [Flavobacterium sp. Arc2]|uniref:hypothetical protein n=1 Tax=Flavobacterium sp. Arc2 TaxID=3046685 RepID=UPI00352E2ACF
MQKKDLKETWKKQKERLKQKFAALTDTDVLFLEGKKEEMMVKLQLKLGKTRQELNQIINGL